MSRHEIPAARRFSRTLCAVRTRRFARFEATVWDTREMGWSARISLPTGVRPGTPFAATEVWIDVSTVNGVPQIDRIQGVHHNRAGLAEDGARLTDAQIVDARKAAECLAGKFAAELAAQHAAYQAARRAEVAAKISAEVAAGDVIWAVALAARWGLPLPIPVPHVAA